jgi:hypothetical protein
MVVALAGRRVDGPKAKAKQFPSVNLICVRERIRAELLFRNADSLVCSAACGADLLALDAAGDLGIRRRIVLPFPKERFRATSVTDRPGDWGPLFDRIVSEVEASGDLVVLPGADDDDQAYAAANHSILDEALSMAAPSDSRAGAIVVWNSAERGKEDLTAAFMREAREKGLSVKELSTL